MSCQGPTKALNITFPYSQLYFNSRVNDSYLIQTFSSFKQKKNSLKIEIKKVVMNKTIKKLFIFFKYSY